MDNAIEIKNEQIVRGCTLAGAGAKFDVDITFEEWMNAGRYLKAVEGAIQFALGDWLNYGDMVFGEKYSQALDETDYAYQSLANFSWLCRKVKIENRVVGLSFAHHRLVAKFTPDQQDEFLAYAFEEMKRRKGGYSTDEFRTWIKSQIDGGEGGGEQGSGSGLPSSDDFKNALIYIRDLCEETPISSLPKKEEIESMFGALTAIKKECTKLVGVKR